MIVDRMAVALEASVLLRYGHARIAELYIESRVSPWLNGEGGGTTSHNLGNTSLGANYGSFVYSPSHSKEIIEDSMAPLFSL